MEKERTEKEVLKEKIPCGEKSPSSLNSGVLNKNFSFSQNEEEIEEWIHETAKRIADVIILRYAFSEKEASKIQSFFFPRRGGM
ncbi:MAG: hypothetical protein DSO07_02220, partial [Thermoproteota archaeon]